MQTRLQQRLHSCLPILLSLFSMSTMALICFGDGSQRTGLERVCITGTVFTSVSKDCRGKGCEDDRAPHSGYRFRSSLPSPDC
jgi:hypothetical protein